jgi:hypothetical protein
VREILSREHHGSERTSEIGAASCVEDPDFSGRRNVTIGSDFAQARVHGRGDGEKQKTKNSTRHARGVDPRRLHNTTTTRAFS